MTLLLLFCLLLLWLLAVAPTTNNTVQWFQNIRLPYYHMLHDGRFQNMKSLFEFYYAMLPVSQARTRAWFNETGTFFPETKQQNGLYASGSLGWSCHSADPRAPLPGNTYIRYHREGGLELSLMAVDWLAHTGDTAYFKLKLLPQIELYVEYYAQHFKDDAHGKLDMFPGQALETWQCKTVPPTRDTCVTNPMPQVRVVCFRFLRCISFAPAAEVESMFYFAVVCLLMHFQHAFVYNVQVAGLHALLPRLLALDASTVTPAMQEKWRALLNRVPDLPTGPCRQGQKNADECLLPGAELPPATSNSENAEV